MRLVELSAHDWDIRQPYETPPHLSPSALPALLGAIPEMQFQFLEQRLSEGLDGVYVLRAGDAAWDFTVHGKTVTYQAAAPTSCDACLSTDAESMILLTVGRADVTAKLQSAALTMTGDAGKGQQLCATLFRSF
jgi:predicted lipid carrier protein YhbT